MPKSKLSATTTFARWKLGNADAYVNDFLGTTEASPASHQTYTFDHNRLSIVIPAILLLKALFKPSARVFDYLFRPAGLDMLVAPQQNNGSGEFPPQSTSLRSMLVNGTDKRFRQAMYDFTSASAAMLDVRAKYAAYLGITPPQFSILSPVGELGSASVGQIASHLGVSSPFVTAESNKLVKQKLLRK